MEGSIVLLYIIGDSTAATKTRLEKPQSGWGEYLYSYLGIRTQQVVNLAKNGRSTKSFIDEGRLDKLLKVIKKDDTVLIQFGHNDEKKDNKSLYAAPFGQYSDNLILFISEIRKKDARPILLNSISRRKFINGVLADTHGSYIPAVLQVATMTQTPLIDINGYSRVLLKQMGSENSRKLFNQLPKNVNSNYPDGITDNTHFSELGANIFALYIANELKRLV